MSKIISIELNNFKKHEHLELDIQGRSVFLLGPNEAGKSSILDSVWFALNPGKETPLNKIPKPLRGGAKDGSVKIVIGKDDKEYTVIRKFTEGSDERKLTIIGSDGMKTTKVDMLEVLIGYNKIDPFEFVAWSASADGRRKQLAMIEALLSEDVRDKLNKVKADVILAENAATAANAEKQTCEKSITTLGVTEADLLTYAEPIDVAAEMTKLKEAQTENALIKGAVDLKATHEKTKSQNDTLILEKQEAIKKLQEEVNALGNKNQQLDDEIFGIDIFIDQHEVIDTTSIEKTINDATEHNNKNTLVNKYNEAKGKLTEATEKWNREKRSIELFRESRREIIASSKLPIPDLSFDDEQIYLGEIPLNDKQISTSQIMKLSFAIALATGKNPNALKLICIPRGESLDNHSINELKAFLHENPEWQAFLEEVDRGKEELTIEYFES